MSVPHNIPGSQPLQTQAQRFQDRIEEQTMQVERLQFDNDILQTRLDDICADIEPRVARIEAGMANIAAEDKKTIEKLLEQNLKLMEELEEANQRTEAEKANLESAVEEMKMWKGRYHELRRELDGVEEVEGEGDVDEEYTGPRKLVGHADAKYLTGRRS